MEFYLGIPVKKGLFKSPLRKDSTPTVSFYRNKSGTLVLHDFNGSFHGDVFAVVMHKFNCSFSEAILMIANDFGLIDQPGVKKNKPKLEYDGAVLEENSKTAIIQVEIRPFQDYELEWWARYGITEKTLKKYHVFSCKNVWLNGNIFHLEKENQLVFGYYGGTKDGIELWRIYFPQRKNAKWKFIANWPSSKIQGAKQLDTSNTDFLVIQKAMKDLMVMHEYGIPSIAPNSENTPISDKTLAKLQSKYKKIVYWFDNDNPGKEAMARVKEKHPEIICYCLPDDSEKDVSDFRKKHGKKATDKLIEEFKEFINGQTNEKINTEEDRKTE